jgi:hypothetical protein
MSLQYTGAKVPLTLGVPVIPDTLVAVMLGMSASVSITLSA